MVRKPIGKYLPVFLLFFIATLLRPAFACSAPGVEERHVENFYSWYISESLKAKSNPVKDDAIHAYVCRATVNAVRAGFENGTLDADYFLKSQDVWPEWLDSMTVHPATALDETMSIVPVSFTLEKDKRHHLVVFLRNDAGAVCITKVSGAQDFPE